MRKIIIDTDPGIDDAAAIAIAMFSRELDVQLITTVAGNVSLDKTTHNALRLMSLWGSDVPVAAGATARWWDRCTMPRRPTESRAWRALTLTR